VKNWEKLARACRRYLDAYNDELADDVTLGSVGNDLRIIAIREVLPDGETEQLREKLRISEASAARRLNRISGALSELLRGGQDARDVRRAAIGILQGQEDRRLARVYGEANPPADPEPTEATNG